MSEITIPPSPGWYLSNILACSDDGSVVAYGAKHEVVLFRPTAPSADQSKLDLRPSFIPLAHKDRIVAVAFGPSRGEAAAFRTHLATASDDGSVHVWDHVTETLILSHSGHGDGQKVVGLDWSVADPNMVVSVSDMGSLVVWDLQGNTIRRQSLPNKTLPLVLACCPHNRDLVAVGCKSGLVVIFNTRGDGFAAHKLRGHDTDVVSLSWCPAPHNVLKDEANNDTRTFLLASGAKDRSIYLWRAGSDGRYELFVNLPNQPLATGGYRTKAGLSNTGSHWICVRWVEPLKLLTSSLFGELLEYDLDQQPAESGRKLKPPRLVHGQHTRGLFSIAAPTQPTKANRRLVWTYALDKHIVACRLDTAKIVSDTTTVGGIVYCIAASPLDPTRVAVGTGDNKILVWNMSNDDCNNVKTFWNKINSKVMAVAWHPVSESILAFGTGEGRIGVIDVNKQASAPKLFRQYHRRSVYSLIWAPPIVELSDHKVFYALFSVGDGDILQHNPDMPDKEPINLSSYFKKCDESAMVSKSLGRTDLAWNHDRSLAAVGNDNGVLYVVDGRTFNHIHTTFAHKKLVQCVVWHPETVTSENAQSPFNTWLASASDNVQVMNVTSSGVDVIASLNSHTEKVVCIAWSPHFNGLLITASYDYTSQVWDVVSGAVLACFDAHHAAVVCVLPSAFHKDWVITGSADNTVRVWNTKNFRLTKTKTKKQRLCGALKKFSNARVAEVIDEDDKAEYSNHRMNGDSHSSTHSTTTKHVEFAANLVTTVGEFKRKPKSMFPVSGSGFSQSKHLGLLWSRITGGEPPKNLSTGNSGYLDFFGDMKCMKRLAVVEGSYHRENGNTYNADQLALWSGNIAGCISEAGKKKQLNDWLVSMAPMVSHRLWVDSCRQYAQQLIESGDTLKGVSYHLLIHQVENAVEALIEAKLFREAVCLAKLRCLPNDPIVKKAVTAWANQAMSNGMLTLAAHCMLSIGANIEAVEILSRSKDPDNLSLASNIAVAADAYEMGLSLAMRAMNTSLEMHNYALAREITKAHSVLDDLGLWIDVCELKKDWQPIEDKAVLSWIVGKQGDNWLGLYESAFKRCTIRVPSYSALAKFLPNKPTPESDQKVWVYIAGQVSLAAAAQLKPTNGTQGVLRHLITALETAYHFHLHNPANSQYFLQLCLWISPWGPLSTLPQFDTNCEYKNYLESFNAFLASGVVYWLEILSAKQLLPTGDPEAMAAISDVIVKCSELLFHKDVMAFHKADVEIKRLENAIASSKLEALKLMKSCKDIEAALTSTGATPKPQPVKEVQPEDDSKKLARLKQFRSDFEEKRLFVPNPFIAFCSLRNVLELTEDKSPEAKAALNKIKDIWENSSGDGTTA